MVFFFILDSRLLAEFMYIMMVSYTVDRASVARRSLDFRFSCSWIFANGVVGRFVFFVRVRGWLFTGLKQSSNQSVFFCKNDDNIILNDLLEKKMLLLLGTSRWLSNQILTKVKINEWKCLLTKCTEAYGFF